MDALHRGLGEIALLQAGSGERALLLHGLGATKASSSPPSPRSPGGLRVYAIARATGAAARRKGWSARLAATRPALDALTARGLCRPPQPPRRDGTPPSGGGAAASSLEAPPAPSRPRGRGRLSRR